MLKIVYDENAVDAIIARMVRHGKIADRIKKGISDHLQKTTDLSTEEIASRLTVTSGGDQISVSMESGKSANPFIKTMSSGDMFEEHSASSYLIDVAHEKDSTADAKKRIKDIINESVLETTMATGTE